MSAAWRKLGRIYCPRPTPLHPKLATHAANPVAYHLESDTFRIFFNGRDSEQRSSIGAVDFDLRTQQLVQEFEAPLFVHGSDDSFYANGMSLGNICQIDGRPVLLFMGWEAAEDGRWKGQIGGLTVRSDATLQLEQTSPLLSPSQIDPISLSYPWALELEDGQICMWYGATHSWDAGNGEMLHVIHASRSKDGRTWTRQGQVLPHALGQAQAFSRPSIVRNSDGSFEMWVSYRGDPDRPYRIGYARSLDGQNWDWRPEHAGITVSQTGWDSEMVEYPFVFDHRGSRWMLYNGDGYGRSGFGLAKWESN